MVRCVNLLVFGAVALAAGQARAERLALDAPIDAVTVYLQGADVTRVGQASLPAGAHELALEGLPQGIDAETLRVRLQAEGGEVTLGDVRLETVFAAEAPGEEQRRLIGEIRDLEAQVRRLNDRIEAQRVKLDAVRATGGAVGDALGGAIATGEADPGTWQAGWDALLNGASSALAEIREAEAEIERLRREIDARRAELDNLNATRKATTTAIAVVRAEKAAEVRAEVGYAVAEASWRPAYELSANAADGRSTLTFTSLAVVGQRSGELWPDVRLTLAGTRPQAFTDLPDPQAWRIDVARPQVARSQGLAMEAAPMAAAPAMADALVQEVQVSATQLSTRFEAPAPVTVPADGGERRVRLGSSERPFDLRAVTWPAQAELATLVAEVTNDTGGVLPAGEAQVRRDGGLVGRTYLDTLPPGETREVPLGVDERVSVERRLDAENSGDQGLFNGRRRLERRFVTSVTNNHGQPVSLTLFERLPVPVDERIRVEPLFGNTQPDRRDVDGQQGVLAYDLALDPGETREVPFGYRASWPQDVRIEGL